jgi:hypothetical protein
VLGALDTAVVDELMTIVTELVLRVTVRTRSDSTLTLHRSGDEITIAVEGSGRSTDLDPAGAWAAISLVAERSNPADRDDVRQS